MSFSCALANAHKINKREMPITAWILVIDGPGRLSTYLHADFGGYAQLSGDHLLHLYRRQGQWLPFAGRPSIRLGSWDTPSCLWL
jgi:hypothetical protein